MEISMLNRIRKQLFHYRHELMTSFCYHIPRVPPHRYVFVLTTKCNLRCKNCYQIKNPTAEPLTKNQWIALAEEIPSHCRITLTGGEPLLYPQFEDLVEAVGKAHHFNIISNGILLSPSLIDFLLSFNKLKILSISIDGIKEDSVNIRGITEKQWQLLESNLQYFVTRRNELKSTCMLDIKSLILDENSERLLELHDYCVNTLQADNHSLQFLKGSPLQHSDTPCSFDDIFEIHSAPVYRTFEIIIEQLGEIGLYNAAHGTSAFLHPPVADLNSGAPLPDLRFVNNPQFEKKLFRQCRFPWSSLHVNYDGEFFPCLSVPIGNFKQKNLKEILRSTDYGAFLSAIKKHGTVPACNRCGWLRLR